MSLTCVETCQDRFSSYSQQVNFHCKIENMASYARRVSGYSDGVDGSFKCHCIPTNALGNLQTERSSRESVRSSNAVGIRQRYPPSVTYLAFSMNVFCCYQRRSCSVLQKHVPVPSIFRVTQPSSKNTLSASSCCKT